MFRIYKNPHSSNFGMGKPNLNPMGKIGSMPSVRVGEYHPASSVVEAKKVIQKGLERSKK